MWRHARSASTSACRTSNIPIPTSHRTCASGSTTSCCASWTSCWRRGCWWCFRYGTLDELLETLTLVQTHKIALPPKVLVGETPWRRAVDFEFLVAEGVIEADCGLFRSPTRCRRSGRAFCVGTRCAGNRCCTPADARMTHGQKGTYQYLVHRRRVPRDVAHPVVGDRQPGADGAVQRVSDATARRQDRASRGGRAYHQCATQAAASRRAQAYRDRARRASVRARSRSIRSQVQRRDGEP